MNEDHIPTPSESDVFAASQPFTESTEPSPFGLTALPFTGVDAFNPAGPVPAIEPSPGTSVEASCLDVHRSLSVYLDGELALSQQNAVRSHLAVCGPCQSAQAFQMQVRTTVASKAFDPMPEEVRARITRALGFE
jgi:mycothiol system anti-sigma-R factor